MIGYITRAQASYDDYPHLDRYWGVDGEVTFARRPRNPNVRVDLSLVVPDFHTGDMNVLHGAGDMVQILPLKMSPDQKRELAYRLLREANYPEPLEPE